MRLRTFSKLLVAGAAVAFAYKHRHRLGFPRRAAAPTPADEAVAFADVGPAPGDLVRGFDDVSDLHVADIDVDALDAADAEAARDLAIWQSDLDETALELDTPEDTTLDAIDRAAEDTGELYGVHAVPAVDRDIPEDEDAFESGQNWIEALETSAAEYGAEPEHELDVVDEVDRPPHPSDARDTPVADRGSGGPSGV